MLELLERSGFAKTLRRDVATTQELKFYADKYAQKRYADYRLLYLAAHGDVGILEWSRGNSTTLDELQVLLGDAVAGRFVHLGSCMTTFDPIAAERFVTNTGAAALMGYRSSVDWLESAAFELILLGELANHEGRASTVFNRLMKRHGAMARLFKFTMVTPREVLRAEDAASGR